MDKKQRKSISETQIGYFILQEDQYAQKLGVKNIIVCGILTRAQTRGRSAINDVVLHIVGAYISLQPWWGNFSEGFSRW